MRESAFRWSDFKNFGTVSILASRTDRGKRKKKGMSREGFEPSPLSWKDRMLTKVPQKIVCFVYTTGPK